MAELQVHRVGRWFIAVSLAVAIVATAVAWQTSRLEADDRSEIDPAAVAQAKGLSQAFRAAAKQVRPTVVTIQTITAPTRVENRGGQRFPGGRNPFEGTPFEDFFDDEGFHGGFQMPPRMTPRQQGMGSGVIIDPEGVILTNSHVVEGADRLVIKMSDGRKFEADADDVKTDPETDLALVLIETDERLPAAKLGDSDGIDIGDWVIAVGNPFGLESTVSAGIISGRGRSLASGLSERRGSRTTFLQTDAAINPGNSGGPLVSLDGRIVGINTAIASNSGGYQGVGFAVPINLAKWAIPQLLQEGEVERAYLGIQMTMIEGDMARRYGLQTPRGILVNEVVPDSPAAAAGFREDDVIVAFAGRPVQELRGLQAVVERSPIGSRQRVDIIRDGKRMTLSVVLKPLPKDLSIASGGSSRQPADSNGEAASYASKDLGLAVTEVTKNVAERFGYEGYDGVLISDVTPGGMADLAGLSEGMLIRSVERRDVKSVEEFREVVESKSLEKGLLLKIRANNRNLLIILKGS